MQLRRSSLRPAQRGLAFTMLEILVAVAILGFILTAIYSCWTAILKAADSGNRAAAVAQRERTARRVVEDALASVQFFTENANYYSFIADTTDESFARLSLVSRLPDSFPGSGMFNSQTRRVTFGVRPGTNGGREFVMSQVPLLIPTNVVEEPYTIKLADHVSLFSLEFWDTNLNDWAVEWLPTNQIPKLMRVALSFSASGNKPDAESIISTVVSLPASAITREMQMPDGRPGRPTPNPIKPVPNPKK